jgi:hypothetical protein
MGVLRECYKSVRRVPQEHHIRYSLSDLWCGPLAITVFRPFRNHQFLFLLLPFSLPPLSVLAPLPPSTVLFVAVVAVAFPVTLTF